MPEQTNMQPENTAPTVGLKKAPAENRQATWAKVEAVFNAAKTAYITKNATLTDVIDSMTATLEDIKTAETQKLGGLGQGAEMEELPAPPAPEELTA